jgi:hypothetical protein
MGVEGHRVAEAKLERDLAAAGHRSKHGSPYAPTAVKRVLSRRHL